MMFLLHQNMVQLTERKNIQIFRNALHNFIVSELEKIGFGKNEEKNSKFDTKDENFIEKQTRIQNKQPVVNETPLIESSNYM